MKTDPHSADTPAPAIKPGKIYASLEEVERAICGLTDADHAKLMLIAHSFCKRRSLGYSEMQPEELLSEAILSTCQLHKKWNKAITIVRHLDRAMENISGHLVRARQEERVKIISFPDGLRPPEEGSQAYQSHEEAAAAAKEQALSMIQAVFGDDDLARKVFLMRVEETEISEILLKLNLAEAQYETITRRIRRRISKFLAQTK